MATMQIKRGEGVKMLQEIGWSAAPKKIDDVDWFKSKMQVGIKKALDDAKEKGQDVFETEESRKLAEDILKAIDQDEDVDFELVPDDNENNGSENSESKTSTKKGGKKMSTATKSAAKGSKSGKTSKSAKTNPNKGASSSGAAKDKWGLREGSAGSRAMAVLSKKAKAMSVIVEEAKLNDTCYDFMKKMIEKKVVVRTDDGFKLA